MKSFRYFLFLTHLFVVGSLFLASCTRQDVVDDSTKTPLPAQVDATVATMALPKSTPSMMVTISSPTATFLPTATIVSTSTGHNPQVEETVPVCLNGEKPASMADLPDIPGIIFYTDEQRAHLFALSNHQVQTVKLTLPDPDINNFTFSKNNRYILAYQYNPEEIQESQKYPVWVISNQGEMSQIDLDMSMMNKVAIKTFTSLVSLQRWTFAWVNDDIVKVTAEYGETKEGGNGNYLYDFYDFSAGNWWKNSLQNLPGRLPYRWIDLAPDGSHLLFVDETFNLKNWDIDHKRSIWTKAIMPFIQLPPESQWSNDSKAVIYTAIPDNNLNLLFVDEGKHTTIRELVFSSSHKNFVPYNFRWSPDNRLLAISGTIYDDQDNSQKTMVYLYDTETGQYIYRCPLGETGPWSNGMDILWSPDGNYIVPLASFDDKIPFRLYDLKSKLVYQIAEAGIAAFGWTDQFPTKWK